MGDDQTTDPDTWTPDRLRDEVAFATTRATATARARWNAQADEWNQWGAISGNERAELIAHEKAAAARDRAAGEARDE